MKWKMAFPSVLLVAFLLPAGAPAQVIERVSLSSAGGEGNGDSWVTARQRAVSADGRFIAFESDANNLVADDLNGWKDVFLRDRLLSTTTRVSVNSVGLDANGASVAPSISADGHFVAFTSAANDLVVGDTNWEWDVFVRDLELGQTFRVSVSPDGGDGNDDSLSASISADGRYVAFVSYARNLVPGGANWRSNVYVRDLQLGETVLASVGWDGTLTDQNSWGAVISGVGRHVVFTSGATNLVSDDSNGANDIFVRDLDLGVTTRASVDELGGDPNARSDGPTIDFAGDRVVFHSLATDLVADDTNGVADLFVRDLVADTTTRANLTSGGLQATGAGSWRPTISDDGRYVAFLSDAGDLVPGDGNGHGDIFTRDRSTGSTARVSTNRFGIEGNEWSGNPSISAGGEVVVFESVAGNLIEGDSNGARDVFVSLGPAVIFSAGFETGDTSMWSDVLP